MRSFRVLFCCLLAGAMSISAAQHTNISKEYASAAAQIAGSAMVEEKAYEKLEYLSDRIGHRLSGSPQLDQAIQWAIAQMKSDGLENVHAEPVLVPHWVRGSDEEPLIPRLDGYSPVRHTSPRAHCRGGLRPEKTKHPVTRRGPYRNSAGTIEL